MKAVHNSKAYIMSGVGLPQRHRATEYLNIIIILSVALCLCGSPTAHSLAATAWSFAVPTTNPQIAPRNPEPGVPKSEIDAADVGRPAFRTFTDRDGLPKNVILTIAIDHKNYLWVGTQDGAAYYNGRKWIPVKIPNRSNYINAMLVLSDGGICFGTYDGGLSILGVDGKYTTFDTSSGLPDNQVNCLLETITPDGRRTLWVGTSRGGLARLENSHWTIFDKSSGLPDDRVDCLLETIAADGTRTLWAGTYKGGLARLENGHWTIFNTYNSGLPHNRVNSLLETRAPDGRHTLWVGTDGGLARLENGQWTVFNSENSGLPNNLLYGILETTERDGRRTLWIGTYGGGLARLENGRWTILNVKSGLPSNQIWCLLKAVKQNGAYTLWIGSYGGGLASLECGKWTVYDTNSGLPSNQVWSLLETSEPDGDNALWFGTDNGLARLKNGQWTIYDARSGLPFNVVLSLAETISADGTRALWVGTDGGGLARLENGQWTVFNSENSGLPDNTVNSLLETRAPDGTRTLWIGTYNGGLASLKNGKWTIYDNKSGLPSNRLYELLETVSADGTRTLWAGTSGGLARFQDGKWTTYDKNSGLPSNIVYGLVETTSQDGVHNLWVSTTSGVARVNLTPKNDPLIMPLSTTNLALPSNTFYLIRVDSKGRIYLTTNKGIARLTPHTPMPDDPSEYKVYTFTTEDGLPSNEYSRASMIDSKGRFWAATVGGAAMLDPSKEFEDLFPKPLYIEKALLADKDRALFPNDSLAYNENNLTFEYALLSYFRDSDTRYKTQLAGFEEKPSEWTADYKSRYTNLPEGNYTFKVWGRDYIGNVSGPVEIAFKVRPAPWRTWWAYTLYFVALIGIGYGSNRYRLQVLERRNKMLEAKIIERTDQLAKKNEDLAEALDQVKLSNKELANKNQELIESHQRADRIFSALAEALPGTVLDGKYRLGEKIGSGGFGAVYHATHLAMKRPVAVKVFKPAPGNDSAGALERFQLEAISACRINHPNAVAVLDSGISSEGIAYLVMELLEGHSLTQELRRKGVLSIERTAQILAPVCEVLAKAHSMGIVHRDIKPDNIFLHRSEQGEVVKVVDFGIAKLMESTDSVDARSLTGTGGIIGTPTYMSPERLEGKPYDGRSDVYGLGVMLYEMLCGHPPFQSDSGRVFALVQMHLTKEPRLLREINANISQEVEAVVLRALAKDPKNRPTAMELGREFLAASGVDLASLSLVKESLNNDSANVDMEWAEKAPTLEIENRKGLSGEVFREVEGLLGVMLQREPDHLNELLRATRGISDLQKEMESLTAAEEQAKRENSISPERWQQIKSLFFTLMECEPDRRAALLDEACAGDLDLRRNVEALIAADEEGSEGFCGNFHKGP